MLNGGAGLLSCPEITLLSGGEDRKTRENKKRRRNHIEMWRGSTTPQETEVQITSTQLQSRWLQTGFQSYTKMYWGATHSNTHFMQIFDLQTIKVLQIVCRFYANI